MSTYNNNYHLKKHASFTNFLQCPQISKEKKMLDYRTKKILNIEDNNKTIFEIRKYKFDKICEYKEKHENVILINLEFIQNDRNLFHFLNFLAEKYMPSMMNKKFDLSFKHTKSKSKEKNRKYNINIEKYRDIINLNKNDEMEQCINALTFKL